MGQSLSPARIRKFCHLEFSDDGRLPIRDLNLKDSFGVFRLECQRTQFRVGDI
jgi:hypothetical protein